MNNYTLLRNTT